MKRTTQFLTASMLAGGLILVNPLAGFSATDDEIADALLESTIELLDVTVTEDSDLVDTLAADLEYAVEEEVIDQELVEAVSLALDEGTELDLTEALEENLSEQTGVWPDEAVELKAGLEVVKQEFYQCRASTEGPANECARGFGLQIQVALAEGQLQQVEQLQARLGELSGDALAQAEAELLQAQERLTLRIERVERKIVRTESRGEDAEALRESLREIEESPAGGQSRQGSPAAPQGGPADDQDDTDRDDSPGNNGNQGQPQGNSGRQDAGNKNKGR